MIPETSDFNQLIVYKAIDFPEKWVHLRKSNTEPIIRIYSEAHTMQEAEEIGEELIQIIREMCK